MLFFCLLTVFDFLFSLAFFKLLAQLLQIFRIPPLYLIQCRLLRDLRTGIIHFAGVQNALYFICTLVHGSPLIHFFTPSRSSIAQEGQSTRRTKQDYDRHHLIHPNGEPVASSRQIAESFGKEHKHVLDSIKNLVAENSAAKSMFYETTFENRGKQYPMYLMNRDGFTLLAMGFTGKAALEWKLKYIQAFNAMEKQLAQRPQLSRAELMAQALIAAHDELEHKDRQIAELTPKGIFADAVNASKKSILVGELAKLLCQNSVQIGQNRLFVWMREHGYLIKDPKRSDYNMPTQRAVEHGLFEIKETTVVHSDGHTSINKTPKVTGKGQIYFVNLFLKG